MVVELSSTGEHELSIPSIVRSARRILGRPDIEVFVPAVSSKVRSDSQVLVYMDGYIFVRYEPGVNYLRLRDNGMFRDVLCSPAKIKGQEPAYALIGDSQLDPLRTGMESLGKASFKVGDRVRIVRGENRNLTGYVCDVGDGLIFISAGLRSKPLILPYPTSYLEKIS